ncbi:thyrotropin-releasing hormone receptor-like [Ptychodera flava]|uniref:thyrotropin-releasing hormone receptor-like n=1 Tax=Ptychodera flava TaxID=63121 RepID=UPI00396AAEBC
MDNVSVYYSPDLATPIVHFYQDMSAANVSLIIAGEIQNSSSNGTEYYNDQSFHRLQVTLRVPMTIIWLLILFVGLLGNVAFMYVIIRVRWMRTVTNYYLMNLSLADVAFLVGNLPIEVAGLYSMSLGNLAVCIITALVTYLSQYVGMFSITILSIERYYAICSPLTAKKLSSKSRSMRLIVFAWIAALLFSSVFLVSCILEPKISVRLRIVLMVVQTVPLVASMIIVLVLYVLIARQVANSTQRDAVTSSKGSRQRKERKQVINLLIITAVIFFLSVCPYQGFLVYYNCLNIGLVSAFLKEPLVMLRRIYIMNIFFVTLLYVNSAINPIIYNVTSSKYRQAFKEAFLCLKGKPHMHHERMFSDRCSEGNGTHTYIMRQNISSPYKHYPVSTLTMPTTV